MITFVENLTLRNWFFSILPYFLRARLAGQGSGTRCFIFDGSKLAVKAAKALRWMSGVDVELFRFRLLDVRDEQGLLIRLRVPTQDLFEVQRQAMEEPALQQVMGDLRQEAPRLATFVAKAMVGSSLLEPRTLWRVVHLIQVCAWKVRSEGLFQEIPIFFIERQKWLCAVSDYALEHGIKTIPVARTIRIGDILHRFLTPETRYRLKWLSYRIFPERSQLVPGAGAKGPLMAVEYYGHLNLDRPECHSDLFFRQPFPLADKQILMTFAIPQDPLDEGKRSELEKHGISAVAVDPRSTVSSRTPVFFLRGGSRRFPRGKRPRFGRGMEGQWLKEQVERYRFLRIFWEKLFALHHVKIYVFWFKYSGLHCAIADALASLGGVTAIYQRGFESHPSVEATVNADIVFGFSQKVAGLEERSNSRIRYHVTVGYLGDHRFSLLKPESQRVRQLLMSHGSKKIVSFTDENSMDDARWHTGHELQREHYAYLLEKVLSHPWLGLVVKPKVPKTLMKRLGPVAELLKRAQATGRCFVYEAGPIHSSYAPAVAAMASDLMISGHLCAGTAGMESALAGVPTLLLDPEGWPVSPLYRLGVGKVVFTDWPSLWKQCMEHWTRPGGVPGFGDWSSMLDELDPFRDGRATERMGVYLRWLLDGFKAGLDRETVMADAAERYSRRWGKDKITSVHGQEAPARLMPELCLSRT